MDLGTYVFCVCVVLICCSNSEDISCPCPEILPVNLAEPPPNTCFQINDSFRYTCKPGFVRKAGTSNLIRCRQTNGSAQWTPCSLQCIPDPRITTTEPPKTTVTAASTSLQMTQSTSMSVSVTAHRQNTEPTSSSQRVPSDRSQAASTSLQMTQSTSMSVSVTAHRQSTEPTSSGQRIPSDRSQGKIDSMKEVSAGHGPRSISTTAEPPNNKLSSKTAALSAIGSLVIICAFIGFYFLFYKRRSTHNVAQPTAEEQIPMNEDAAAPAS